MIQCPGAGFHGRPGWRLGLLLVGLLLLLAGPARSARIHDAIRRGDLGEVLGCLHQGRAVNSTFDGWRTALYLAVEEDQVEIARVLLSKGANPSVVNRSMTPMICQARSRSMVELLLRRGADLSAQDPRNGRAPLHLAVQRGDRETISLLLGQNVPVNQADYKGVTPLHEALRPDAPWPDDQIVLIELLLRSGADCSLARFSDRSTPLHQAVQQDRMRLVQSMLTQRPDLEARDAKGRTVLHRARTRAMVELLLNAGAEVNARQVGGRTVLHQWLRSIPMTRLLLHWGADPAQPDAVGMTPLRLARQQFPDRPELHRLLGETEPTGGSASTRSESSTVRDPSLDRYGWGDLHRACEGATPDRVSELLGTGLDVDQPTASGLAPLHIAARGGRLEVVRRLLDAGALVNFQDETGETPLHAAARVGHREVVEELLERGADTGARTDRGATPGDLAERYGHLKLAEILGRPISTSPNRR